MKLVLKEVFFFLFQEAMPGWVVTTSQARFYKLTGQMDRNYAHTSLFAQCYNNFDGHPHAHHHHYQKPGTTTHPLAGGAK